MLARVARNTVIDAARAIRAEKRSGSQVRLVLSDWSGAGVRAGEIPASTPGPATRLRLREDEAHLLQRLSFSLRVEDGAATDLETRTGEFSPSIDGFTVGPFITSFGQDAGGELYIVQRGSNGKVFKIVPRPRSLAPGGSRIASRRVRTRSASFSKLWMAGTDEPA